MMDPKLKKIFEKTDHTTRQAWVETAFCRQVSAAALAGCDQLITLPSGLGKTTTALNIMTSARPSGAVWYVAPSNRLGRYQISLLKNALAGIEPSFMTHIIQQRQHPEVIIWSADVLYQHLTSRPLSSVPAAWPSPALIIIDDAEFLGIPEQGLLETLMLLLPEQVPLILLSHPVSNAAVVADWLARLRNRPCHLQTVPVSPMPRLNVFISTDWEMTLLLDRKKLAGKVKRLLADNVRFPTPSRRAQGLASLLGSEHLLPAMVLLPSPLDCDAAAEVLIAPQDAPNSDVLTHSAVAGLLENHPFLKDYSALNTAISKRAAAYHTGHHPLYLLLVEYFLSVKALDLIFADLPGILQMTSRVRSVVLYCPESQTFGQSTVSLAESHVSRMVRLAGRPGTDPSGCVALLQAPNIDAVGLKDLLLAENGPLLSTWECDCPTVLGLLTRGPEPQVLLDRSLRVCQQNRFGTFCWQSLQQMLLTELPEAACEVHIKTITSLIQSGLKLEIHLNKVREQLDKKPAPPLRRQLKAEKQRLETLLAQFPCETCPHVGFCRKKGSRKLRKLFEAWHQMAATFNRSITGLNDDLLFYLKLLRAFDYTDSCQQLTPAGRLALNTGLRLPFGLVSCLEQELLPKTDESLSLALLAGFVRLEKQWTRQLPESLISLAEMLEPLQAALRPTLNEAQSRLLRFGVLLPSPIPMQSTLLLAWRQGREVPALHRLTGAPQGYLTDLAEQTLHLATRTGFGAALTAEG